MKEEKISISAYGAYTNGEEIWIPSNEFNALFYMKIGDGKAKKLTKFDNLLNDEAWKIGKVISYKEELFFFSRYAYEVWILGKNSSELNAIIYSTARQLTISDVTVFNNEAWIFPFTLEMPIIIFDLAKKKIIKEVKWGNYTKHQISEHSNILRTIVYEESIYTATREKNNIHICKIDCSTKKITFYKIDEAEFISCISVDKSGVWLFIKSQEGKAALECYNLALNERTYYKEVETAGTWPEGVKLPFFKMIHYNEWIVAIPALAQELIAYNVNTKEERRLLHSEQYLLPVPETPEAMFFECEMINNKLYLYPLRREGMLVLDLERWSIVEIKVSCEYGVYIESCIQSSNIIKERSGLRLENLCSYLQNTSNADNQEITNCGKVIYENLTKR